MALSNPLAQRRSLQLQVSDTDGGLPAVSAPASDNNQIAKVSLTSRLQGNLREQAAFRDTQRLRWSAKLEFSIPAAILGALIGASVLFAALAYLRALPDAPADRKSVV